MIRKFLALFFISLFSLSPLMAAEEETTPPDTEIIAPQGDVSEVPKDHYSTQFNRTLIVILGLIVVIFLGILILRRFSHNRPLLLNQHKNIKILERRPLSPNTFLYHIEVGGKQFILAESKFHIKTVATLQWSEEVEE